MTMTSKRPDRVIRADQVPGPRQGDWTYSHYAALPEDGQRYEIVDGVLYMAPSPTGEHQDTAGRFYHYLLMLVEFVGLGKVRLAPFDVRLDERTVVQPDVMVILKASLSKLHKTYVLGAPDLVIEIASPKTASYDRHEKQDDYALAGVPEYWIVDTNSRTIEVLSLEQGVYHSLGVFTRAQTLRSLVVPQIGTIQAEQFFPPAE